MNLFSADLDRITFADILDFLGLKGPVEHRPPEGLRIDYKLKEPADFPEAVAAFANTFGGLLFIGVGTVDPVTKQKHNVPLSLPGETFTGGDIKARITGKILAQVTPRPDVQIGVAAIVPSQPDTAVAVIRVGPGTWPPYQFAARDTVRIPVRIQDTNRQATVREIEEMFRRRATTTETTQERLSALDVSTPLAPPVYYEAADPGRTGGSPSTQAYQSWTIRPRAPLRVRLDRSFDANIRSVLKRHTGDLGSFFPPDITKDVHVVKWQARINNQEHGHLTYANTVQFSSDGDIRYSEKIDRHTNATESVADLFIDSLRFLGFAAQFYQTRDYFGGLSISQQIRCLTPITVAAVFPDANCIYHATNTIAFPQGGGQAQGTSTMMQEIESLDPELRQDLVLEFMLGHLRQLCRASIDYEGLRSVVQGLPSRISAPYF